MCGISHVKLWDINGLKTKYEKQKRWRKFIKGKERERAGKCHLEMTGFTLK
jgi:hypothetical protein